MKYVLSLICLFSLSSCCTIPIIPREIIRRSTIKFEEGKSTGIRDLIEIDGYYTRDQQYDSGDQPRMFFEDGTYVSFSFRDNISKAESQANLSGARRAWRKWMQPNQLEWGSQWGIYTIQNDTIIVYEYEPPCTLNGMSIAEIRYKVVDRNTVRMISHKDISRPNEEYNEIHTRSPWVDGLPHYFVPADSLPPSDNWLKGKKWMWRNKSDWKAYKQMIKQKKKQFKKQRTTVKISSLF